ncbi:MAG: glycosyltransferase [Nitrospirae bacterium]|nr:glycosyltransferase [Nitrospirota bacterium]
MAGSEPLISIVIPTYNRALLLRRALQSVLEQTIVEWEVLVVDNHSNDDTDDVVMGFNDPRIRLLKIHNNGIIAASRNLGINEACGKWVAFLDSDDWWTPVKLEVSLNALSEGNDIVYHDLALITNGWMDYLRRRVQTWQVRSPAYRDLKMRGNAIATSSVVVNRALIIELGGLSERPDLVTCEDFECWLRLAQVTERFCRLQGTYGYYWSAGDNTSSSGKKISSLAAIAELHLDSETEAAALPVWYRYALGSSNFHLKNYQDARRIVASIPMMKVPASTFLKLLYMRLYMVMLRSA